MKPTKSDKNRWIVLTTNDTCHQKIDKKKMKKKIMKRSEKKKKMERKMYTNVTRWCAAAVAPKQYLSSCFCVCSQFFYFICSWLYLWIYCVKVVEKCFIVSLYEHYRGQPLVDLVKWFSFILFFLSCFSLFPWF